MHRPKICPRPIKAPYKLPNRSYLTIRPSVGTVVGMIIVLLILFAVVFGMTLEFVPDRSRRRLDRWAEKNGYRLVQAEPRASGRETAAFCFDGDERRFEVTLATRDGRQQRTRVRCGGWLGNAVWADRIQG